MNSNKQGDSSEVVTEVSFKSLVNMKTATILSCLAALANASAVNSDKGESALVVNMEQFATSNTVNAPLRILRNDGILDRSPVEKVAVLKGGI